MCPARSASRLDRFYVIPTSAERRTQLNTLPLHVSSRLVLAKRDEARVSEVKVGGPFDKFKLPNQPWPQPTAFLHLGGGQARAPAASSHLRKIGERAGLGLQAAKALYEFHPQRRREAVSCAAGVEQFPSFLI
jgi:hypothetical protein